MTQESSRVNSNTTGRIWLGGGYDLNIIVKYSSILYAMLNLLQEM